MQPLQLNILSDLNKTFSIPTCPSWKKRALGFQKNCCFLSVLSSNIAQLNITMMLTSSRCFPKNQTFYTKLFTVREHFTIIPDTFIFNSVGQNSFHQSHNFQSVIKAVLQAASHFHSYFHEFQLVHKKAERYVCQLSFNLTETTGPIHLQEKVKFKKTQQYLATQAIVWGSLSKARVYKFA